LQRESYYKQNRRGEKGRKGEGREERKIRYIGRASSKFAVGPLKIRERDCDMELSGIFEGRSDRTERE